MFGIVYATTIARFVAQRVTRITRMSVRGVPMYLNKKVTRQRILDKVKAARPGWDCTRVSDSAIRKLDAKIDAMLDAAVHQHPSNGKTFNQILFGG